MMWLIQDKDHKIQQHNVEDNQTPVTTARMSLGPNLWLFTLSDFRTEFPLFLSQIMPMTLGMESSDQEIRGEMARRPFAFMVWVFLYYTLFFFMEAWNNSTLTGYPLCQNVRHLATRGKNSHAHVVDNKNLKKYMRGLELKLFLESYWETFTFHSPSFFTLLMTPLRISVKDIHVNFNKSVNYTS